MAIKMFCDVCHNEITRNYVVDRLCRIKDLVRVLVHVSIGNQWDQGELCEKCLLNAVCNGKDVGEHARRTDEEMKGND
jgi:hypothetical protein